MKRRKRLILLRELGVLTMGLVQISALGQTSFSRSDTVFCGSTKIVFSQRCETPLDSILLVHVHEDETTAVQAANWLLDSTRQGCFVTWKSQQQRYVSFEMNDKKYRFDPNRIFSEEGIRTTLEFGEKQDQKTIEAVKNVAETFESRYIADRKLIVALHNNTNAGLLSIASYKKGAVYGNDAKLVFINAPTQDPDDFFYTTERSYFNYLKQLGFNVVLQDDATVTDDGSLSVYCAQHHIPYINIEAQHGHLQQQKRMLGVIWKLIKVGMPATVSTN